MKKNYEYTLRMLFYIGKLGKLNKPLTPSILSNPYHKITVHLLQLYSMQSFIFVNLNHACRSKDKDQIEFYGPFAAAISYIIHFTNKKRNDQIKGQTIVYRGLKMEK